jgi:hypothetical protein
MFPLRNDQGSQPTIGTIQGKNPKTSMVERDPFPNCTQSLESRRAEFDAILGTLDPPLMAVPIAKRIGMPDRISGREGCGRHLSVAVAIPLDT